MKYFLQILLLCPSILLAQLSTPQFTDSLIESLSRARPDTNKVVVLNAISYKLNQYDAVKGLKYGQDALQLARQLRWPAGIGKSQNSIGANEEMLGNTERALAAFEEAIAAFSEANDKKGLAQGMGNVAIIYTDQGNSVKALEYLFKALKIFEELNDKRGIAIQHGNIASLYEYLKKFPEALKHDSIALIKYREIGDKDGEALLLGNTANVYVDKGELDSAIALINESNNIFQKQGNKDGIARNLGNLGTVYCTKDDFYKALHCQLEALKLYQDLNNRNGIAGSYANIGTYYYRIAVDTKDFHAEQNIPSTKAGCLQLAITYCKKGIEMYQETSDLYALAYCYKMLADAQRNAKDYKNAIESFLQYSVYQDSTFSLENNKKITDLENQRKLDLKESKIKLLAQENGMKDLRAAKDKQTRRALLGGLGMIVIAALSLVMYFIRKQRSDRLIANERINTLLKDQELQSVSNMLEIQEQERKRIAADLHDRLGSMLSTVKLYFNSVEDQINTLKQQNREQYQKATSLLDEACDEVRKISHNLVSGELVKFGLVSALNQLKETISDTGQLKMAVMAFGMEKRLDSAMEISLYRIVQELMNNILKHAKATEITIQLNKVDDNLNIMIEDNGIGFDVEAALKKDGMGLRNMQTRVKKLNGTISVDSYKGRGTTTIIDIPVPPEQTA
jgi:two-component system, NarL family, sensor kinase